MTFILCHHRKTISATERELILTNLSRHLTQDYYTQVAQTVSTARSRTPSLRDQSETAAYVAMRTYARFSARPTISHYATRQVCFIGRLTYVLYVLITMSITSIFFPEMNINPPSMQSSCVPKLCNWQSSTRVNDRSVSCPLCRQRTLPNQVALR